MLAHPEAVHVSGALDRYDSKTPSLGIARSAVNLVAALTREYLDIIDEIAGGAIEVGVGGRVLGPRVAIGAEQYVVAPRPLAAGLQRLRVDGDRERSLAHCHEHVTGGDDVHVRVARRVVVDETLPE